VYESGSVRLAWHCWNGAVGLLACFKTCVYVCFSLLLTCYIYTLQLVIILLLPPSQVGGVEVVPLIKNNISLRRLEMERKSQRCCISA